MEQYTLLTGGTGFIGSHLLERLLENNKVILLKRSFSDTWRIDKFINNDNLLLLDIDKTNLTDIFNNYQIEGIFHLAAAYIKNPTHEDIMTTVKSNIEFPTELLDLASNNNVKYFINTGTYFEYSLAKLPLTESSNVDSLNFYSTSKIAFEDILKYYSKEYDINASTLKLYTPYGPRDDESKIIPYLILNTLNKQEIKINNPNNRLDIVHVYDIIDAYINLKENILKFKKYESFNVARDIDYSINDIYQTIKFNLEIENKNIIDNNKKEMFSDPTKIKEILNWEPKIDINDGIKNTIEYYKNKYNIKWR